MELALSLGDNSKPFTYLGKPSSSTSSKLSKDLGFCMALKSSEKIITSSSDDDNENERRLVVHQKFSSSIPLIDRPVQQLDLLPFSPVHSSRRQISFPWLSDNMVNEPGSGEVTGGKGGFDVNNRLSVEETEDMSSPNNSGASSFQMDLAIISSNNGVNRNINNKRDIDSFDCERTSSRASDDEENGLTRKKLRLSKEQSAFLEESFKEHSTLNPKQKLALAKQLNLRPRQVEVWFQNRRARTKLKQTEVDCEYLKRCCETLTEENRRLQKELQELRALKTSQPFYMQLPATTLTMCPSCERVATTTTASSGTTTTATAVTAAVPNTKNNNPSTTITSTSLSLANNNNNSKPNLYPFNSHAQVHQAQAS